jgi:Metal-sensitive transcriptional repressor
MEVEFTGRLHLRRTAEEKQPLLQRLGRIEGQVRGLRQMVEDDRFCQTSRQRGSDWRFRWLRVVSRPVGGRGSGMECVCCGSAAVAERPERTARG